MASSILSYISSVGILSVLLASSSSLLRLSMQIDSIRGFILAKDAHSLNIYSAQPARTPATQYANSTTKKIPTLANYLAISIFPS
jgi:hypothetical protein